MQSSWLSCSVGTDGCPKNGGDAATLMTGFRVEMASEYPNKNVRFRFEINKRPHRAARTRAACPPSPPGFNVGVPGAATCVARLGVYLSRPQQRLLLGEPPTLNPGGKGGGGASDPPDGRLFISNRYRRRRTSIDPAHTRRRRPADFPVKERVVDCCVTPKFRPDTVARPRSL